MKIAIISDIHGNYDALVAVLNDAKKQDVTHLLVLGDIVGYYYHPDKILKLLSNWSFDIIKGNHEYILENLIENPSKAAIIHSKYGSGHQEAIKKLSSNQLQFLKNLPDTKTVIFDEIVILMSHGSPWSNDFYIYPDVDLETLLKCDSALHDFVLIGHSHYQFTIKNKNSILINPGSVGQSRQKGGKAFWAIINTENQCFQMLNTKYDTKNILAEIAQKDADVPYLSTILSRN
jgi:predicted phosphodiesterase